MSNILKVSPVFLFALFLLLANKISLAAVRCETQYGGGETCVTTGELQINKKIFDPDSSQFVDNLNLSSHRFGAGDQVTFQLQITNTGDATFGTVHVVDTLPAHLQFVSGSLDFDISNLDPGETQTFQIQAKVVSADQFPSDQSLLCEVNRAEATADDEDDVDTAQLCMETKVLGAKILPPTGPVYTPYLILASLALGASGFYLRFKKI